MASAINRLELGDVNVRVNLRRCYIAVPKELLYYPEIGSVSQEVGSKAMSSIKI